MNLSSLPSHSHTDERALPAIPLPAPIFMLGASLAGLGALRLRR